MLLTKSASAAELVIKSNLYKLDIRHAEWLLNYAKVTSVPNTFTIPANKFTGVYYFLVDDKQVKLSGGDKGNLAWLINIRRNLKTLNIIILYLTMKSC